MADETRDGNTERARFRYNVAYWASLARDRLGEAMRP